MNESELRDKILALTKEYYKKKFHEKSFKPGETYVYYSGRVFDHNELTNLVEASLDFWLTAGRFAEKFEREFAKFTGSRHCLLTNSGSSANLLALSALTAKSLGERQLKPGDEIITVAAGFPTTVNPIFQNSLVSVFCDIELGTNNINVKELESAVSEKTMAIMLAHTLGNPFNIDAVLAVKKKYNIMEDQNQWARIHTREMNVLVNPIGIFSHE